MSTESVELDPKALEAARQAYKFGGLIYASERPINEGALRDAINAYLQASASVPQDSGVAVKVLEWENDGPMQWAHGSCITYHIERVHPHPKSGYRYYAVSGKDVLGFFANVLDARAAAQADYEARIRSALLPSTGVPPT